MFGFVVVSYRSSLSFVHSFSKSFSFITFCILFHCTLSHTGELRSLSNNIARCVERRRNSHRSSLHSFIHSSFIHSLTSPLTGSILSPQVSYAPFQATPPAASSDDDAAVDSPSTKKKGASAAAALASDNDANGIGSGGSGGGGVIYTERFDNSVAPVYSHSHTQPLPSRERR
jgi:hypothetical protein